MINKKEKKNMLLNFKHMSTLPGFDRVNYLAKNELGQKFFYCLQLEDGEMVLYKCSEDFEPDCLVQKFQLGIITTFQKILKPIALIDFRVNAWIEKGGIVL